jgi:type III secretion protein R
MSNLPDPFYIIIVLSLLALAPFMAVMVTSFIKLVVVLSLVRNALGIQAIPPNMVINGLAIILTLFIMAPVGQDVFVLLKGRDLAKKDFQTMTQAADEAKAPLKEFLMKHSQRRERQFFMRTAKAIWPEGKAEDLKADDMIVLIPAFTVSELTTAFQIGFLLYLPFVAIDLIVSNILLAMGMMMVSPMTISLPFKLLLFVLLDGWARLIHGLVLTYG